jgi:mannose-1-phosphate guanylyltransferase
MQHFDENDVVVVLSADHIMKDEDSFATTIKNLEKDAESKLILF